MKKIETSVPMLAVIAGTRGLLGAGIGLVLLIAVLGVDWQALLERHEFKWSLRFRGRGQSAAIQPAQSALK